MNSIIETIKSIWAKEPTLVLGALTAIVVFVCAKLGVVVPEQTVAEALAYAIPVLLGFFGARTRVSPAK